MKEGKISGRIANAAKCLGLTAVFAAVGPDASASVDLTKWIRETGTENYAVELEDGTQTIGGTYPVANAFDGAWALHDNSKRCLLQTVRTDGDRSCPVAVVYRIPDGCLENYSFRLSEFRLYGLNTGHPEYPGATYANDTAAASDFNSYDKHRNPYAFALEGYDGDGWKTLFETNAETWASRGEEKIYSIPEENRGDYRKFRFTISQSNGDTWCSGFQELRFFGELTPRRLVWNGGEGSRWNASGENWLDESGNATAWIPGARAVFGVGTSTTSIAVDGTNEVGGIDFTVGRPCSISGGSLALSSPFEILAGSGDVIASRIIDAPATNFYKGVTNGVPQYFPCESEDNLWTGAWRLLWRNRKLSGITDFSGAMIDREETIGDFSSRAVHSAVAANHVNDGVSASVQFQYKIPEGSQGAKQVVCVKLLLEQKVSDVWGRVQYARYTWCGNEGSLTNAEPEVGYDFDADELHVVNPQGVPLFDDYHNKGLGGYRSYGLYGVTPLGGEFSSETVAVNTGVSGSGAHNDVADVHQDFLPRQAGNDYTGDAVLLFPEMHVADLEAVVGGSTWLHDDLTLPPTVHYFANDGTTAHAQFQSPVVSGNSRFRICVKVEFTDGEGGVFGRIDYAKYRYWYPSGTYEPEWTIGMECDFDDFDFSGGGTWDGTTQTGLSKVGNGTSASGYNVTNIVARFKGGRVTLSARPIALDRDFAGNGWVRFAVDGHANPDQIQKINVSGNRTIDRAMFDGLMMQKVAFPADASLRLKDFDIGDTASVDLAGRKASKGQLRIGSSNCLSEDELGRFTCNDEPGVRQLNDGKIVWRIGMTSVFK